MVESIDHLGEVRANTPLNDNWLVLFDAQQQLEALFNQSVYRPYLRTSREKASDLHDTISSILGDGSEMERNIAEYQVWSLTQQREQFRLVFLSELSTLPAFLVQPKEGYDVSLLTAAGSILFPKSLLQKVPEAETDSMEAGKALAFELATSCGFHVFRIVESTLKRYWDEVSDKKDRPKLEIIGSYSIELDKGKFGDEKVWESLKQLAKLHRNPLIHPEVILSVEEAIGIVGIARSVVGMMLQKLPDAAPTTGVFVPEKNSDE